MLAFKTNRKTRKNCKSKTIFEKSTKKPKATFFCHYLNPSYLPSKNDLH